MSEVYKHYKGGLYVRLFEGTASCDIEQDSRITVYLSMQNGEVYVRTSDNFHDPIRADDGLTFGPPRFEKLTERETGTAVDKRMKLLKLDKKYAKPKKRKRT